MDEDPAKAVVLRALTERADQVIRNLEERKITGMAAMDEFAALVVEKEETRKAAEDSGLTDVGFAVLWQLKQDESLATPGLDSLAVAREVEAVLAKFPNWIENPDEQRRLRLNLYKPVIMLPDAQRKAAVEQIMQVLEETARD
jgi:type I restriction enzyme R subunit